MTATTTSTTKSAKNHGSNQQATRQAVDANTSYLRFHLGDTEVDVNLPPLNKLAFYAGLSAGAVFGLIAWPIAILTGVEHLLSDDRHHRTLQALGEALDAA